MTSARPTAKHEGAPQGGVAGVVLAGGRSSRMGTDKATLPWEGTTLLAHVVDLLDAALGGPLVVVRAPGQARPALRAGVTVADDAAEGRGPLQGIAAGLAAAADAGAARAFVAAVDLPLLTAALVRAVAGALDDAHDVAIPVVDGHRQPLAAAYRTALAPLAAELAAGSRRGTAVLLERCRVRELAEAELPGAARALRDVDTPADLLAAALTSARGERDQGPDWGSP